MYSCEWLYALSGDPVWAERLEKAAFNALPATISDDMWSHQYDQQVNQIACQTFPGRSIFRTNGPESHLFGLEPNYGCCTANFNQGWPKLAMSTFLRTESGVHSAMMTPAKLVTEIGGVPVKIDVESEYPFRLNARYTVTAEAPVSFDLSIRIPGWAESVTVNGEPAENTGSIVFSREWNGTETIDIAVTSTPRFVSRPGKLQAVTWGALVFALPIETEYKMIEYERGGVERKFPYCDYELIPRSEWRYGFDSDELTVENRPMSDIPFSSKEPAVVINAKMARVSWDYADGFETVAAEKHRSNRALGDQEEKALHPYGCAKLRMTEMPVARR